MRAILRTRFGGPEVLVIRDIPEPTPIEGHVVIEVKAFGLNHAELHMRKGGMGRDRRRQRHRVCRYRQVLSRRRVRSRDEGGGVDGWAGPDD